VFHGPALQEVLRLPWLSRHHLVAHNALFEYGFLQVTGVPPGQIECTMLGGALLLGKPRISLADAAVARLDLEPPKALQTSDWSAQLSHGQVCYAASDAILAFKLWPIIETELHEKGRWAPYELDRDVIPAVAALQLTGMRFDLEKHAEQVAEWEREDAEAREWFALHHGTAPPDRNRVRDWLKRYLPTIGRQ